MIPIKDNYSQKYGIVPDCARVRDNPSEMFPCDAMVSIYVYKVMTMLLSGDLHGGSFTRLRDYQNRVLRSRSLWASWY